MNKNDIENSVLISKNVLEQLISFSYANGIIGVFDEMRRAGENKNISYENLKKSGDEHVKKTMITVEKLGTKINV